MQKIKAAVISSMLLMGASICFASPQSVKTQQATLLWQIGHDSSGRMDMTNSLLQHEDVQLQQQHTAAAIGRCGGNPPPAPAWLAPFCPGGPKCDPAPLCE